MVSKKYIDRLANQAATSPLNNIKDPSEDQIKSGNYKKGHIKLHGLNISIENPKGSTRSGTSPDGKKWSIKLKNHYGYINGNKIGKDGDPVDVFIGENPKSEKVFVVNQLNVEDNSNTFDEHKALIGFNSISDAVRGYLQNYKPGWDEKGMIDSIVQSDTKVFKDWLNNGNLKRPFRGIS